MKIGITGSNGFAAWHLRCYLHSLGDVISDIKLADRITFNYSDRLESFVKDCDFIIHLAGVNRASDEDLEKGNVEPAEKLVAALQEIGAKPTLLFANSTHAIEPYTTYGRAKAKVSKIFSDWAIHENTRFINLIIPHVFGEYGKPYYNSGVSTFCYEIANGIESQINPDGRLELVHVQDLVELMIELYQLGYTGDYRVEGKCISVPNIVDKIKNFRLQYLECGQFPDLSSDFDRALFNTFRAAIKHEDRIVTPKQHRDERGWLVETLKAHSGGQCFVSSTHSGITRGNHYHRKKVERFFVLSGNAEIKLRKLFSSQVLSFKLCATSPSYIDIPTLHTHNITNIGKDELITLFWTDEFYNPEKSDTYFLGVEELSPI
jgi:UDP-2-acetamido-2,6-beta-L-arabino-hexul-4-ose reductase